MEKSKGYLRLFRGLVVVALLGSMTGCDPFSSVTKAIENATKVLDAQAGDLNKNISDINGLLSDSLASVTDGTVRGEVNSVIGNFQQANNATIANSIDFARAMLKEDLRDLNDKIHKQPLRPREPYIGAANPLVIRFSSTSNQVLQFAGWHLNKDSLADKFTVSVKSASGERLLPKDVITSPTPYQLIVNFSTESNSMLTRNDKEVIGRWGNKELFSIPILPPYDNMQIEMETTVGGWQESDHVSLVANGNGEVGDHDLSSDNRDPRTEQPRCQQGSNVWLKAEGEQILFMIKAHFNEALPDFTRLESTSGWRKIFSIDPHDGNVKEARTKLNLSHDYDGASVTISKINSPTEGAVYAGEFNESVTVLRENGCVEAWELYGDHDGDDDDAKVRVRLKPIKYTMLFSMPDGAVALQVPNALIKGIELKQ